MSYRETLYTNYSRHFDVSKVGSEAQHWAMLDATYGTDWVADGPVLDLGCGRGAWLRWAKAKGVKELEGVDLSALDLEAAADSGATLHQQSIFEFLADEKRRGVYAIVHAKDLIEHLTKDEVVEFLTGIRVILKPGGKLWVSTFNALAPGAVDTWRGDFTHETAFSPRSMAQVMRACGFESVDVRAIHPVPPGWKGSLRRLLYLPMRRLMGMAIQLRYGFSKDVQTAPTLVGVGTTPAAGEQGKKG